MAQAVGVGRVSGVLAGECSERVRELEAEVERLRALVEELKAANARLLEELRRVEVERDRAQAKVEFYEDDCPDEGWHC